MSKVLEILIKAMDKSNGKARVVDVPTERIPNHQQLKKLDTEILAQVNLQSEKGVKHE